MSNEFFSCSGISSIKWKWRLYFTWYMLLTATTIFYLGKWILIILYNYHHTHNHWNIGFYLYTWSSPICCQLNFQICTKWSTLLILELLAHSSLLVSHKLIHYPILIEIVLILIGYSHVSNRADSVLFETWLKVLINTRINTWFTWFTKMFKVYLVKRVKKTESVLLFTTFTLF